MATPPAGIRHNNPFDVSLPIHGWSGGGKIVGLPGQSTYAEFPSLAIGYAAGQQRIKDYIDVKGYDTIAKMGAHYATDPNWPHTVSRISGEIGINDVLDTKNSAQMTRLEHAILTAELGAQWAGEVIAQIQQGPAPKPPAPPPVVQPPPVQPPPGPTPMPTISPQILAAILQLAMMLINDLITQQGGIPPLVPSGAQPPVPGIPSQPQASGDFIQSLLQAFLPAMQQNFESTILPQIETIIARQLAALNPTQPPK